MSFESPPIDHFSPEAQQAYAEHLAARSELTLLGAQVAISGVGQPVEPLIDTYKSAIHATTNLYISAYRKQGRFDRDIASKLMPRLGDEYDKYASDELQQAQAIPGFSSELEAYLSQRYKIDQASVNRQIDRSALQPLNLAMFSIVSQIGAVVAAHIDGNRR